MIRAERITVTYGRGVERVVALREASAQFVGGRMACIMGPSGSGKTTLLSVLAGLRRPDKGQVWLHDCRIDTLSAAALADVRRRAVGLVFQNFRLLRNVDVRDNLRAAGEVFGIPRDQQDSAARHALEAVGLSGKEKRSVWELSGGEKQRVAIARAILGSPAAILADEPTASLDGENGRRCSQLLREVCERMKCAVVIVTHDTRLADVCDERWRLDDGTLSLDG